jgi:hypothetical protein
MSLLRDGRHPRLGVEVPEGGHDEGREGLQLEAGWHAEPSLHDRSVLLGVHGGVEPRARLVHEAELGGVGAEHALLGEGAERVLLPALSDVDLLGERVRQDLQHLLPVPHGGTGREPEPRERGTVARGVLVGGDGCDLAHVRRLLL